MAAGRAFVIISWLVLIGSFFAPAGSTLATWGRIGFVLMAVAHVIEFAVFLPRIKAAGGPLGGHFVQTLIFGMFHIGTLPEAAPAD